MRSIYLKMKPTKINLNQSLIKIALTEQGLKELINENFGVAFSTINFYNQCVL